ncbi:MAG TPA: FkbM family methyltransferase [Candidatus Eremiobacteraceae bacterium]|nr:FkbM family methyltransferase [Candidatus Eremiobacteraceae bacterium]
MALREKGKTLLLRTYQLWSRLLPPVYLPYKFEGGWIYLNLRESSMMLQRALGRYEPEKHQALRHFLRPGATFVDVGCNKGDFALAAARLVGSGGRVLAFEPHPENCRWTRKSIAKNGYRNIDLQQLALSDTNGTATLHLGEKSGFHSLIGGLAQRNEGTIAVKTRRLDDLLLGMGWIDAIKIDVEGAEMQVLRGAQETLAAQRSLAVLLDVHSHLGVNAEEVCAFLRGLGFTLYAEQRPFNVPLEVRPSVTSLVAVRNC